MELLNTVMELAAKWLPVALAVLGGAVLVLAALAPITASKRDDKLLATLRKFESWLVRVVVPMIATRKAAGLSGEQAEAAKAAKEDDKTS